MRLNEGHGRWQQPSSVRGWDVRRDGSGADVHKLGPGSLASGDEKRLWGK